MRHSRLQHGCGGPMWAVLRPGVGADCRQHSVEPVGPPRPRSRFRVAVCQFYRPPELIQIVTVLMH
jgi:hypothetical protein